MHPKSFVSNFWGAVQTLLRGREFNRNEAVLH